MAQQGTFFRSIDLAYFQLGTPLSAMGSRTHGGRYNHKGDFEALYVADSQRTALYETRAIYNVSGKVVGVRQAPRVMMSLDYELADIVDLRAQTTLDALGIKVNDLKLPWKLAQSQNKPILTQRIGAAARAVEIEALLVPSARVSSGTNLVIFTDRLRVGSMVELYVGTLSTVPRYAIKGAFKATIR